MAVFFCFYLWSSVANSASFEFCKEVHLSFKPQLIFDPSLLQSIHLEFVSAYNSFLIPDPTYCIQTKVTKLLKVASQMKPEELFATVDMEMQVELSSYNYFISFNFSL